MTRISSVEVVAKMSEQDKKGLQDANKLADNYWLEGIPMSAVHSHECREFGQFMNSLTAKEKLNVYALVHTMMTASKLS